MGGSTIPTKLTAKIIEELKHGIYKNAERLPAEVELAEQYSVSRSVIRDVLSNLEREGFVSRVRGVGTVIHHDIVNLRTRIDLKHEYANLVLDMGAIPSIDGLRLSEKLADEKLAEQLNITVGDEILVYEKRILADKKPVIYSIDHLPASLFAHVDFRTLQWDKPVFDILEEICGIMVDTDIAKFRATNATPKIRKMLGVPDEEPLILIDEVAYYKFSKPIFHTLGYYTNYFDFTILRKKF